jgi:hypothetical protein
MSTSWWNIGEAGVRGQQAVWRRGVLALVTTVVLLWLITTAPAVAGPAGEVVGSDVVAPGSLRDRSVVSTTVATFEATRVARQLGEVMWTFDWRVPPVKATAALRPWVTPGLWAELRNSPCAPASLASRVQNHELDRVTSISAVVADTSPNDRRAPTAIGVAVSAAVTVVRNGHGVGGGRDDAEMLVVRSAMGWRVAEIDL